MKSVTDNLTLAQRRRPWADCCILRSKPGNGSVITRDQLRVWMGFWVTHESRNGAKSLERSNEHILKADHLISISNWLPGYVVHFVTWEECSTVTHVQKEEKGCQLIFLDNLHFFIVIRTQMSTQNTIPRWSIISVKYLIVLSEYGRTRATNTFCLV